MGIINQIFGKPDAKKVDALETIGDVQAALVRVAQEREAAQRVVSESLAKRRELLLIDGSDKKIAELDTAVDAAHLALERLDEAEPRLHERLRDLHDAARRDLLDELRRIYERRAAALDAAMMDVLPALADYVEITRQLDASGFETEARGFVTKPPFVGEGVLVSENTIELWRRERERLADMNSRSAAGAPLRVVPHSIAGVTPEIAAANREVRKPKSPPATERDYHPTPSRTPRRCDETPGFGRSKIVVLRSGLEIENERHVAGDEFIVSNEVADKLLRAAAVDLVARGELEGAAE